VQVSYAQIYIRMKQNVKLIFWVLMIAVAWNKSSGQNFERKPPRNCPVEEIQMHISHESAFTGEICWFKIYCTSPSLPGAEISNLAFVELISSENNSILRKKIWLKNGEGTGEFEIPDNLSTGLYYILAYTNWLKNFGETSFFMKEMIIINPTQPFQNTINNLDSLVKQPASTADKTDPDQLQLLPDKQIYAPRDLVSLKIEMTGIPGKKVPGNFSVSVYRKEPRMIFNIKKNRVEDVIKKPDEISYLPDYKGIRFSGKLSDLSGNIVTGAFTTSSLPGPGTDINSSITDSKGNFNFLLKPGEGERDIVVTVPDANTKISLEESFWNGFRNPPDSLFVGIDREVITYLKEKFAHFQIQKRFKTQYSKMKTPVSNVADSIVFYSNPDQVIKINNYISLDSLGEYFYELVPSVKFIQRRDESSFSVIDPKTFSNIVEKPGVFLDGVLYDNYTEIANIPVEEIDRMAIIPHTYYYKDFTFGGIIDIHTKKSDFNRVKILPNMTRFIFPLANASEWKFVSPDYSTSDSLGRIPDFRYLLHWEPYVKLDSTGEAAVHFYTGDDPGNFMIKVVGITGEGKILRAEKEIFIK
jgi:hypothetical protein